MLGRRTRRVMSGWYRRLVVLAAVAVALALPTAALAWFWDQTYAGNTTFAPGGIALSAFQQSLRYNIMQWNNNGMFGQITLCDSSYNCYPYTYTNNGTVNDYRTISYGRAKCNSWSGNTLDIYVQSCYVQAFG